ncbi:FlxA-like family protein [Symbiopectobacterium purcellii]|uniref:FlxA-like family protein n=1 Tax=Symbiopectobacterium purcellii TaxID=2871826 RepID=UPI003F84CA34
MSVTLGSITLGMLNTQASSNGSTVEQSIQHLQKQIVKLTKSLKALNGKAANAGSVKESDMLKKQRALIQQQIQALYAEIARLHVNTD